LDHAPGPLILAKGLGKAKLNFLGLTTDDDFKWYLKNGRCQIAVSGEFDGQVLQRANLSRFEQLEIILHELFEIGTVLQHLGDVGAEAVKVAGPRLQ
jgi:hypothetical protein